MCTYPLRAKSFFSLALQSWYLIAIERTLSLQVNVDIIMPCQIKNTYAYIITNVIFCCSSSPINPDSIEFEEGLRSGVKYVSHSDSSIQVRVEDERPGGRYRTALFNVTGAGDIPYYRLMQRCMQNRNPVASFDCGGRTPLN